MEEHTDIIWFDTLESTNSEARRRFSDLDNLSVIAAVRQSAGRGQGDHTWCSEPGANLTFTVVLKFGPDGGLRPLAASDSLLITEVITLALRLYLEEKGIEARIKWPNDIWVGDRKICGILIENIFKGSQVQGSMVGIGLNLNQKTFPADLPNPVSLTSLTGDTYNVKEELEKLHGFIAQCAEKTDTDEGRRYLDDIFNKYMFRLS